MIIPLWAILAACVQSAGDGAGRAEKAAGEAAAPAGTSREAAARATFDARRAVVHLPGGSVVAAEIADTPERVALGYMFRSEVGEGEGMIFVFHPADVHPFWMKNTLVPLDMIWMDQDFNVLHIQPSAPPCKADPCPSFGPPRKISYVLELRAGTTARLGLKVGDRLNVVFPFEGESR